MRAGGSSIAAGRRVHGGSRGVKRRAVLSLAAFALTAPPAALAEPPADTLAAGRAVAGCVAKYHSDLIGIYLGQSLATPDKPLGEDMKDALRGCMIQVGPVDSNLMRLDDDTLRALFAEAWLLDEDNAFTVPVADSRPDYAARWISRAADQSVVDRMALCMTSAHPAEAAVLVRTVPGSAAESTAIAALSPYFGGCLVKDATLKINRNGVRLAVAKAVYYRDHMAGAAPALAGKN